MYDDKVDEKIEMNLVAHSDIDAEWPKYWGKLRLILDLWSHIF